MKLLTLKKSLKPVENIEYDIEELELGIREELEHTTDRKTAEKIAKHHLAQNKNYYSSKHFQALHKEEEKMKNKDVKKSLAEQGINTIAGLRKKYTELMKAKGGEKAGHKYYKRVPVSGGKYKYYYTKEEWNNRDKKGSKKETATSTKDDTQSTKNKLEDKDINAEIKKLNDEEVLKQFKAMKISDTVNEQKRLKYNGLLGELKNRGIKVPPDPDISKSFSNYYSPLEKGKKGEQKAGAKYYKREPKSDGSYKYYYTKEQYLKEKQAGDKQREGRINRQPKPSSGMNEGMKKMKGGLDSMFNDVTFHKDMNSFSIRQEGMDSKGIMSMINEKIGRTSVLKEHGFDVHRAGGKNVVIKFVGKSEKKKEPKWEETYLKEGSGWGKHKFKDAKGVDGDDIYDIKEGDVFLHTEEETGAKNVVRITTANNMNQKHNDRFDGELKGVFVDPDNTTKNRDKSDKEFRITDSHINSGSYFKLEKE